MADTIDFLSQTGSGKAMHLNSGDVLFEQGDPASALYIVKSGAVRVHVGDFTLETVGPGNILGEMALVDRLPRSASATAVIDSDLAAIDEGQFLSALRERPDFALMVLRVAIRRLRAADKLLGEAAMGEGTT